MATDILKHIDIISNEIRNNQGEDYAKQYSHIALELLNKNSHSNDEIHILIEATFCLIDDDFRCKLIDDLRKHIKQQNIKIDKLEKDFIELKNDNTQLKQEITILNKNMNFLMKKHYNIILWQAYKNIEYYIIQTITNYDDKTMDKLNTNLTEFKKDPNNSKYIESINNMIITLNINKFSHCLGKLNKTRNRDAHPEPIEIDELKEACLEMKNDYNGIEELYNIYQKIF
jgi:hypothetical protein